MMVAAACAVPGPVSTAISPSIVHSYSVISGGQRIDAVQMVALHPVLQLAGWSPVSAPASNMAMTTTFTAMGCD